MHGAHRPRRRDWLAGLAAGAALGLIVLGAGGRAGMRIIALAAGQPPAFTIEGTIAVVLLGGAAGAAVAVIFLLVRVMLPGRRWLRGTLFWLIVAAIALRGLRPVGALNASVFLPLFLVHGVTLHVLWCRVLSRHVAAPGGDRAPESSLSGVRDASAVA